MSVTEKWLPNAAYVPGTFGYLTFTERIPVIITRLIDSLFSKMAVDASIDHSATIRDLAALKHVLTRRCCIINKVTDNFEDASNYNEFIDQLVSYCPDDPTPTYRNCAWIATECILYRKIFEIFALTADTICMSYFSSQKEMQFHSDEAYICHIVNFTLDILRTVNRWNKYENLDVLPSLLLNCLWANRMDLSLSGGLVVETEKKVLSNFSKMNTDLEKFLLCDDTRFVLDYLKSTDIAVIDIVLDNYASEFIADLCLAVYLLHSKIATRVRLHCKRIPWFVSDVQRVDFFNMLRNLRDLELTEFEYMVTDSLTQNRITIEDDIFWTGPYTYDSMQETCGSLYKQLSESSLIIFKGDLNYRKLVGDYVMPIDTDFKLSLCGFLPAPILAIRTLKANTVSGLNLERFNELNPPEDWMTSGKYGVIQFAK